MRVTQPIVPGYVELARQGELARRAEAARARLKSCDLCAQGCGVDRTAGETGRCRTREQAWVYGHHPHFGEEAPLVGWRGSGTIFFAWCNLRCQFCQNYDISQQGQGREVDTDELAGMMMELQERGCHNINLVSPSHVVPMILAALAVAAERGLRLPLVYNTGGFDSVETLKLLEGIIDIYMPDMKCNDPELAEQLIGAFDYPTRNRAAVREMHRQVGNLTVDSNGLARRGLIVRHLLLPGQLAGTAGIAAFVAREISPDTYFNLMNQYHPCYLAAKGQGLDRRLTAAEYEAAVEVAKQAGLRRFDQMPAIPP